MGSLTFEKLWEATHKLARHNRPAVIEYRSRRYEVIACPQDKVMRLRPESVEGAGISLVQSSFDRLGLARAQLATPLFAEGA